MEDTTYHDPAVVELIRQHFVPIQVDVDSQPDIAQRYGTIGWPATAFFTPDAQTILEVGAYVDPQTFLGILHKVLDAKTAVSAKAEQPSPKSASASTKVVPFSNEVAIPSPQAAQGKNLEIITSMSVWAGQELLRYYDTELGGWGRRQKAPVANAEEFAFWQAYKTHDAAWRKRAFSSLLVQRALLDPVWGGVYQYSVGGSWNKPHFEKIMTVQAGALENYAQAYAASKDRRFLWVLHMMTDYFNNFLSSPEGFFYTSQDADAGTLDGNDYFCLSNTERRGIGIPRVDTNMYARENGLAISAFCKAYATTLDEKLRKRALRAADLILERYKNPGGGFVHKAQTGADVLYLADNAAFGRALVDCCQITGETRYLSVAKDVAAFMLRDLSSPDGYGFFANTQDPQAVGAFAERTKPFQENVLAVRFLLALHGVTKDPKLRDAAEKTLVFLSDESKLKEEGRFLGNYLMATEEYLNEPLHLLVLGSKSDTRAAELHQSALAYYAPHKILEWQDPKENPEITKTYPAFDHPVVYVCGSNRCSSPIANAKELAKSIDTFLEK